MPRHMHRAGAGTACRVMLPPGYCLWTRGGGGRGGGGCLGPCPAPADPPPPIPHIRNTFLRQKMKCIKGAEI